MTIGSQPVPQHLGPSAAGARPTDAAPLGATDTIGVLCPFDENAIHSLADAAHRDGRLVARLVPRRTLPPPAARCVSGVLPAGSGPRRYLDRAQDRVARSALPEDLVVGPVSEILRIGGARFRTPLTAWVGAFLWRVAFDHACAGIPLPDSDVLIGLPGSSLRTFMRHADRFLVVHEVDAHPRAHNEALLAVYGPRTAAAELYPRPLVERIEAELALADVVLTPSRLVTGQMTDHGVPAGKVVTVPFGVGTWRGGAAHRGEPGRRRRPRIVCVAQISLRKGIPFLLRAVRGLDVDLVIVGNVFDRRIVAAAPGNVTLLGALPPAELAREYARADAFVLPTIEDAFGLVVTEAVSSGLPVITTSAAGAAEVLTEPTGAGEPVHRVVPPGDVAALREALRSVPPLTGERRAEIAASVRRSAPDGSWPAYAGAVYGALAVTRAPRAEDAP